MANGGLKASSVFLLMVGLAMLPNPALAAHQLPPPPNLTHLQEQSLSSRSPQSSSLAATQQSTEKKVSAYTLPPETYKKARELSQIHFRMALIDFAYGLFVLWLILQLRLAPKYRDWAQGLSSKRFVTSPICPAILGDARHLKLAYGNL